MLGINPKVAESLHNNLTPEKAREVEIEREERSFGLVYEVCKYTNEYIEFKKLSIRDQIEFQEKNGYSPEKYLCGALEKIFLRSLAGHGSESKALSILYGEDVILNHNINRTGDLVGDIFSNNNLEKLLRIGEQEDVIKITFENLPFIPKSTEYSSESPGYYTVEILISKDEFNNNTVMQMADEKRRDLEIMGMNPPSNE